MNFLELCKRVRQDSGVTGEGPAAVTSQIGILSRIVNWTKQANNDIQESNPSFTFLRKSKSTSLVATVGTYNASMLNIEPVKSITSIYINGDRLTIVDYTDWLDDLVKFSDSVTSKPTHATLDDDGNIQFYPKPNEAFDISIVYQRKPVQLVANNDIPIFDESFHEMIVCKALMFYADYEEDIYRYGRAEMEYEQWKSLMADRYLPKIKLL